jgi:hypothetical protein
MVESSGSGEEDRRREAADSGGGDPVCWLASMCPEWGRFVEEPLPAACAR